MDSKDININHRSFANITREDVKSKFANDPRLEQILTIFDKLDGLDENKTGTLSSMDLTEMAGHDAGKHYVSLDNSHDGKVTDYELQKYFESAKEFFGDGVEVEDYRKFLGFVVSEGEKGYSKVLDETAQETGMSKELVEKLGVGIANEYKIVIRDGKKYLEREIEGFKELRDESGKLLELREKESSIIGYEGSEQITTYDSQGIETSDTYINHKTGETTKFQYGTNPEDKSYKLHVKDGIAVKQSHAASADDPNWKNLQLEDIVFGAGTSDSTKVSFKYDENNQLVGIDIKDENSEEDKPHGFITDGDVFLTHVPKKTSVDTSTVEALKSMLDGGARYGEDYDLKIVDGKLQVLPKIKNETGKEAPALKGAAFDKYKDLVSKGVHQDEDFEVEYDENGNFRYNLKNNQAREFDADYRTELYDKDGNLISSFTVKDGEVTSEKIINGQKEVNKMSFDDAFMQLVLSGDFDTAGKILGDNDIVSGGYDIYGPAEKYKELTGRDLIADVYDADKTAGRGNLLAKLRPQWGTGVYSKEQAIKDYHEGYEQFKAIRDFDPYKSQVAGMLPKIERTQKGENAFSEKINNDNFDVKISGGNILITKNNGKELSIDVSKFPENYIKNTISKLSSAVLYDIAASSTPLKLNENINDGDPWATTVNGYYNAKTGINLDPNTTIGQRAISTIVHECGHMCDHIDDKENAIKAIKQYIKDPFFDFYQDKPQTINDRLEALGTFHPVSIGDEKLQETFQKEIENYRKNRPTINANAEYATTNLAEFFAESYSLLNIGDCKSAYVIANFFPESLGRVKEIMEQNRATREK